MQAAGGSCEGNADKPAARVRPAPSCHARSALEPAHEGKLPLSLPPASWHVPVCHGILLCPEVSAMSIVNAAWGW